MTKPKRIKHNNTQMCQVYWNVKNSFETGSVAEREDTHSEIESLFETEPDLKTMFPKMIRMNDSNQLEWDVDKDMLQRMWPSLHYGLGAVLGESYTREVSQAWRKLFSYICIQMHHGMNNPDLEVDVGVKLT
ncbi:cytoglobin-1 [Elysia marginata]|uniref:Cytoglobin-1 n=1 Tax=Elysia marginata TaxID=1093978 RepID=A0AAV4I1U3_9GAST|nr:cytoglobin-1 [Elysia marginata]